MSSAVSTGPAAGSSPDGGTGAPARRAPWGEYVLIGFIPLLGISVLLGARGISVPGSSNTIGPRFFPYIVGTLLVAVAVALAIAVYRGDTGPAEDSEDVDPDQPLDWTAICVIVVAFAAQALLINVVGWPLAVTVMFAAVAKALGAGGIVRQLLAGGALSVVVWLVFVKLLSVALPGGVLLEMIAGV